MTNNKPKPIIIDFASGAANHRRKFGGGKGQMIARAVGLKTLKNPHVIDATAGLGRDAFVLASLGCKVTMIERSPTIFTLLEDALMRGGQSEEIADIITRMSLVNKNAIDYLEQLQEKPDVIYLDPMFPPRTKSALVKKEMRVLHDIVGEDLDADRLLEVALKKAKNRVVVKRPRISEALSDKQPSFVMEGKSNRFDVYIC